jgi:glycosyltransferase involved in cell wall biosynthesis
MQQGGVEFAGNADIVIGIPSFNNARTIGHVVRAAHAGLAKYFPQFNGLIVNSDGGSTDGTREAVLSAKVEDLHLLLLDTPLKAVHRLSLPYHGIPGKGSAFRLVFQIAEKTGAKACAVVDSDLRSITPEWIDLLVRPVLLGGYDFVAPYYHRHKYDGTITNSIIYPLTRAMYGKRIRQPIGGDFGVSPALLRRYLARDDWETDVGRFGIDIWMTTIAVAEGFKVCQSFLGAKLHDAKDPGADLSAMLQQVVGSVFELMGQYERVWKKVRGSEPVDLFGFRFDVGLEPINVNLERMLRIFRQGCQDLREVWATALRPETLGAVTRLGCGEGSPFHIDDELWVRIIYEFAVAYRRHRVERQTLIRSLTPLYIGRVASFVIEVREMNSDEVEERMEHLCVCFEEAKPYLIELWDGHPPATAAPAEPREEKVYVEDAPRNS